MWVWVSWAFDVVESLVSLEDEIKGRESWRREGRLVRDG